MRLNKLFPQILIGYVDNMGCVLTNNECNELTKYVSGLELEITRLNTENARLAAANKWVSVSERLPEEMLNVVILFKNNTPVSVGSYHVSTNTGKQYWFDSVAQYEYDFDQIENWQPLPTPPTEG